MTTATAPKKLTKAQQAIVDLLERHKDDPRYYLAPGRWGGGGRPVVPDENPDVAGISLSRSRRPNAIPDKTWDAVIASGEVRQIVRRGDINQYSWSSQRTYLAQTVYVHRDSPEPDVAPEIARQRAAESKERAKRDAERERKESQPHWKAADYLARVIWDADDAAGKYDPTALIQAAKALGWKPESE